MFETKLKIQRKWTNWRLKGKRDSVTQQVHDKSWLGLVTKVFFKIFLLVLFSMIIILPFAYMILIASLSKGQSDLLTNGQAGIWPKDWEFGPNLKLAAQNGTTAFWPWQTDWQKGYLFSFLLTFSNVLMSIVLKIFITMFLGYAFSLKKWWGKEVVWFILMSLLVLPQVALLSGQRWVVTQMDSDLAFGSMDKFGKFSYRLFTIAIPFIASVFNALMFRNAFESIPKRIKEVAMVDGAAGAKYLFKIAIPMVSPTTLTVIILTTLASWNTFLWPSLIAGTDYRVMSVWLYGAGRVDMGGGKEKVFTSVRMAGAILVIIPMFLFYFLFRSRIMNAISRQGSTIKG